MATATTVDNTITREQLLDEIERLGSMPSIQAIIQPLIGYLNQPPEKLDMQRVVDLISHDNSLAAQCLHMANSPLFGRWQTITTTRGAVIALGVQRMRDIAMSCCVLKMMPTDASGFNPVVFWEHSLACALVSRKLGKRFGIKDPENAYLAGLLHDLGFVANLSLFPDHCKTLLRLTSEPGASLLDLEQKILGFTHCDSGKLLAERWGLAPDIVDVLAYHHQLSVLSQAKALIALINLADRLCRRFGLGLGWKEEIPIDWEHDAAIEVLREEWPLVRSLNLERFAAELQNYLKDVQKLVSVLYRLG